MNSFKHSSQVTAVTREDSSPTKGLLFIFLQLSTRMCVDTNVGMGGHKSGVTHLKVRNVRFRSADTLVLHTVFLTYFYIIIVR